MPQLWWILGGAIAIAIVGLASRGFVRSARTRAAVLDEVRQVLGGAVVEKPPGRGAQVRGRLGALEVTVELRSDATRPRQSPMWRALAVGPVAMERPVEARVGGWEGWIDPWLQLGETLIVPPRGGPEFTLHAEGLATLDHPVVVALRRQGERLGPGAFHARPDLMRIETGFRSTVTENRSLLAYLNAMAEISEWAWARTPGPPGPGVSSHSVLPEGR